MGNHNGKRKVKTAQPEVTQVQQQQRTKSTPQKKNDKQKGGQVQVGKAAPTAFKGHGGERFTSSAPAWRGPGTSSSSAADTGAAAAETRNVQQLRQHKAIVSEAPCMWTTAQQFIAMRPTPLHRDEAL